ncbi:MAG: hypothetical protein AAF717_08315 [Bacteroidota bacterium]
MGIFQIAACLSFVVIAVQDMRERMVQWVLFPLAGLFLALAHYYNTTGWVFLLSCAVNGLLVTLVVLLLWGYTRYIRKQEFLNTSFGLGDILFLYAFALGFPTVTFTVLLSAAIGFALVVWYLLPSLRQSGTVPLAGLMGIFLAATLLLQYIPPGISLYRF